MAKRKPATGPKTAFQQASPPAKKLYEDALWAIREGDLATLKKLVEEQGVSVTRKDADGKRLMDEMALWAGGPVADYVAARVATENARQFSRGAGSDVEAPARARFRPASRP